VDYDALTNFYCQRLAALRSVRSNFDNQWEEAASLIIPSHRNTFLDQGMQLSQATQGQKLTEKQFDSTAAMALQRFASVIESLITPQGAIWHMLKPVDSVLKRNRQVREFYDDLSERVYDYRYRHVSNFVGNSQQVYLGLGAYGNGVLYIDRPDRQKGLRYRNVHMGEAYFVENHALIVDSLYRVMSLDARQLVQKFGKEVLPKEIIDAADQATNTTKFQVLHAVHPREDYMPGGLGKAGMPFKSCYILLEKKSLLREGGYASFPYAVTRYTQSPGETYGRGPAQWVLPAIKVLNEEKKTMLKQGHRIVDPVLLSHDDAQLGSFSLKAGALNPGGVNADGRPLVHVLPTGNIAVNEKMMDIEKATIKDAFLISLFEILVEDRRDMTATEVLERAREKGMLIAPTAGRIESEFLGPMLEREIDLLGQQFLLPKMPPILAQAAAEYRIEYDSPMSRMRRAERTGGFLRALNTAAEYTRLTGDPRALDWFAVDRAMPEIQDAMGAPTRWTSSQEEVDALRQARSEQQQVQQISDVAPALAAVTKQLPAQKA
jgi:hypothetical protein